MTVREADAEPLSLLGETARWKNRVVRKDGTSSYGRLTWPTMQAAKQVADERENEMHALYVRGELSRIMTQDGAIYVDDYSHTEQVELP